LDGLDTAVGDNGALLSGGQRQRLGLARALLRGVDLLLLDEATSAMDEESEGQVLEMLRASGKTVLLVTHRAQARTFAHRVLSFQAGRLVETNTASEACLNA
jgi:ATP-binding cassette subfamily B protein